MSTTCNPVEKVHIKVYQGSVLKKAPPRERYVQIMPNGQPGTVFKGRVYPLYQGCRINILDQGVLSTDCYQAPGDDNTRYLMENLPLFPYGWLDERNIKFKLQVDSALLAFNGSVEFKNKLVAQLETEFTLQLLQRQSHYHWSLFLKPHRPIHAADIEPMVVKLVAIEVEKSFPLAERPEAVPEVLKRQLAEAQAEIASLRKELLSARQRIMQLSMSNPQPR